MIDRNPYQRFLDLRLSLFVFAVLGFCFFYLDRPVASFFHAHSIAYLRVFEYLGEGPLYMALFALLAMGVWLARPRSIWRMRWMGLCLGLLIPYGICLVLKLSLGRARPMLWFSDHIFGFFGPTHQYAYWSFPSGHTTTWMAMAMGFGLIYPRLRTFCLSLGLLLALTRVVSTYHYLTDVLGSAYLVGIEFALMLKVWKRLK